MADNPAPVEHKVTASTLGAGGGLTVAAFINWLLSQYVFHADAPDQVQAFVLLVVTVGGTFLGGYLAPHTTRPAPLRDLPTIPASPED